MHDPVNFPVVMSQTTPNSITCLLCTKSTGVIKDFDKSAWVALRKSAIDRSEESLAASLAEKNSRILGLLEPSHTDGYHASCYRRFVALKPSSKRKRPHSEISSPEESAEFLPPASNTLVAQIFSVTSRTFADLSDLIMQLHPQEDLTSKSSKYTQEDVNMLYRAVSDFGENIKQISDNLRQRHTDQMRILRAQELNMKCPVKTPSSRTLVTSLLPESTKSSHPVHQQQQMSKPKANVSLFNIYIESVMKFLKWSSLIIKDPVHQTIKVVQPPPSASTSTVTVLPRNFQVVSAKTGNHPQQQLANVRSRSHIGPTGFSLPDVTAAEEDDDEEDEDDDELDSEEDYESELMLTVDGRRMVDNEDIDLLDEESDDLSS